MNPGSFIKQILAIGKEFPEAITVLGEFLSVFLGAMRKKKDPRKAIAMAAAVIVAKEAIRR